MVKLTAVFTVHVEITFLTINRRVKLRRNRVTTLTSVINTVFNLNISNIVYNSIIC